MGLLGWVPLPTDLTGKLHPCLPSCHLGRLGEGQKCGKDCQIFFHQVTIPQTETSLEGLGLALECQPEALFLVSLSLPELLWPQTKPNAHVE